MSNDRALNDIKRWEKKKGDDSTWFSHYQECADYFLPDMNNINHQGAEGEKKTTKLYDTTGVDANGDFAAGMYGNLSPSNARWFVLRPKNQKLKTSEAVMRFLDEVTKSVEEELASSNFELQMHEALLSVGAFAMACITMERGKDTALNFISHHIASTWHYENSKGIIDTTFREFEFTARQAVQEFSLDELKDCAEILKAYAEPQKQDTKFTFLHVCEPRRKEDADDPIKTKIEVHPFRSAYLSVKDKCIIREDGVKRNKYLVPRYSKVSNETRGRGPAMQALPTQKILNLAVRDTSIAIEKKASPPLLASSESSFRPIRTKPNSVIYCDGTKDMWPQELECRADINAVQWFIERKENIIRKAFHNDLFQILKDITGTRAEVEILQRIEEGLVLLGPVVGRLQSELYSPLILGAVDILMEAGKIDLNDIPAELVGPDGSLSLAVEYVSRLALAMKMREVRATTDTLAAVAGLFEIAPTMIDNYDFDKVAVGIASRFGMPNEFIRRRDEVVKIRKVRAAEKAQQDALQMVDVGAKAGSNLSKPIDEGSALNSLKQEFGL